ncbi:MAG: histidine triad nucleotide-binding protein [Chloroflexi bacterium RBG_16_68_14]|nr:MAG: histidine triad nucleotide-binding protein [Chloroflexi bacterium RBG_16_68_14]
MTADCLFCRMASGEMPVEKLHDDELCFSIRDINPRAPVHFMVVPREHIPSVREVRDEHGPLLARLVSVANQVADAEGVSQRGYRLAFNCGDDGGQTIHHLHLHVLGGRRLGAEG